MTAEQMHAKMIETAAAVGLPNHYRNDLLVHDLAALHAMEQTGAKRFWWRLRDCGTQFSSHSERYARMGWDDEQQYCYYGDLETGELTLLPTPAAKTTRHF
jgi:hypothetical protein